MDLTLIAVPYHLGRPRLGTGLGPEAYLEAGLEDRLRHHGHRPRTVTVERSAPFRTELAAILDLGEQVAAEVRGAVAGGRFPLVIGGDCGSSLGVTAALADAPTALVWFDAHGDLNTPQTTPSGFLDGMPLAMAMGHAHAEAVSAALRERRVPASLVLHVGARDLDPGERDLIAATGLAAPTSAELIGAGGEPADVLEPRLVELRRTLAGHARQSGQAGAERSYAHLDIDVVDPAEVPAVDFPTPGGLTVAQLVECLAAVQRHLPLAALSVSAYDPAVPDPDDRTLHNGLRVIVAAADTAAGAAAPDPARESAREAGG